MEAILMLLKPCTVHVKLLIMVRGSSSFACPLFRSLIERRSRRDFISPTASHYIPDAARVLDQASPSPLSTPLGDLQALPRKDRAMISRPTWPPCYRGSEGVEAERRSNNPDCRSSLRREFARSLGDLLAGASLAIFRDGEVHAIHHLGIIRGCVPITTRVTVSLCVAHPLGSLEFRGMPRVGRSVRCGPKYSAGCSAGFVAKARLGWSLWCRRWRRVAASTVMAFANFEKSARAYCQTTSG